LEHKNFVKGLTERKEGKGPKPSILGQSAKRRPRRDLSEEKPIHLGRCKPLKTKGARGEGGKGTKPLEKTLRSANAEAGKLII